MAEVLAVNGAVVAAAMLALWLLSLALRDSSIVDIFWGLGFVLVAWVTFFTADGETARRVLLVALVTIWGLRLAGYLAWRNVGKGEDYRYRAMRKRAGDRWWWQSLFQVFALQGVLMWVVALPLQAGQVPGGGLNLLDAAGAACWAVGLFFETVGDLQLARFKADPAREGQVMDRGLWRYTRHPNYFGDFMVWWGLYLIALATGDAWWTVLGPVVMTVLLMKVSGAGLLERSLTKRKPKYEDYVRRTNAFFPGPPRD